MKKTILFCFSIVLLISITGSHAFGESATIDPLSIERIADSVFMVKTYGGNGKLLGTGSAFLMFNNRTLITNYHVINNAQTAIAESDDGDEYFINRVLIASEKWDVAILQLSAPTIIEPLSSSEEEMMRGSQVIVVGSPKGFKNTVSTGIVSSLYMEDDIRWIQFTAPVSPGSSGGPIFDGSGNVIGMTTWNRTDAQNLNFGLSITNVIELYQKWDGHTSWSINEYSKAVYKGHVLHEVLPSTNVSKMPYTITFSGLGNRNGYYTGETLNGIPHGYGIFVSKNSEGIEWHYIGEWQLGKMQGNGSTYWDSNKHENGIYKDNDMVSGRITYEMSEKIVDWYNQFDDEGHQYFEFVSGDIIVKGYANIEKRVVVKGERKNEKDEWKLMSSKECETLSPYVAYPNQ